MAIYDISSVLLRSQHKKPPYICDGYQDLVFGWVKNPINTCKYKERYRPNRCGSVGHCPAKQKAAGLVPGQGTCLGCRFGPWSEHVQEATGGCFSPCLSPSIPFSLKIKYQGSLYFQGGPSHYNLLIKFNHVVPRFKLFQQFSPIQDKDQTP